MSSHSTILDDMIIRVAKRLNHIILLTLWWDGLKADPGEKRGPRKDVECRIKWKARLCLTLTTPIREELSEISQL